MWYIKLDHANSVHVFDHYAVAKQWSKEHNFPISGFCSFEDLNIIAERCSITYHYKNLT